MTSHDAASAQPDRSPAPDAHEVALAVIAESLRETFEGAPPSGPTFLSDHTAASGLLGTVAGCDAGVATTPSRPGGPSIAAHVQHVAFSLGVARDRLAGRTPSSEWEASWQVGPLDAAGWNALRARLEREYHSTREALTTARAGSRDPLAALHTATWTLGHAAYHLGAVRAALRTIEGGRGPVADRA